MEAHVLNPRTQEVEVGRSHTEGKPGVLVKVSITGRKHHNHGNSYKGETLHWGGLHVQRFHLFYHGVTWWCADMVLEKELRVLRLDSQATGSGLSHWAFFEHI